MNPGAPCDGCDLSVLQFSWMPTEPGRQGCATCSSAAQGSCLRGRRVCAAAAHTLVSRALNPGPSCPNLGSHTPSSRRLEQTWIRGECPEWRHLLKGDWASSLCLWPKRGRMRAGAQWGRQHGWATPLHHGNCIWGRRPQALGAYCSTSRSKSFSFSGKGGSKKKEGSRCEPGPKF